MNTGSGLRADLGSLLARSSRVQFANIESEQRANIASLCVHKWLFYYMFCTYKTQIERNGWFNPLWTSRISHLGTWDGHFNWGKSDNRQRLLCDLIARLLLWLLMCNRVMAGNAFLSDVLHISAETNGTLKDILWVLLLLCRQISFVFTVLCTLTCLK